MFTDLVNYEERLLYDEKEIRERVKELGKQILKDYKGKDILVIGVLKGSFIFLADLVRFIENPLRLDFVRLASYGNSTETSGDVQLIKDIELDINGQHVLVVEDIVDTGITVLFLKKHLLKKKPASLKFCALLDKPARRRVDIKIDYVGFKVPDLFLIGYGLDLGEKYRHIPQIYALYPKGE